jgi:hypothetical protein
MNTKQILLAIIILTSLFGCDKEDPVIDKNIIMTEVSFTGCKTELKSADTGIPSVRLTGQTGDNLLVEWINTEFCCGTDSISISSTVNGNDIKVEIIDLGPFTWCFCAHDLEFSIGPLDRSEYNLTLIESENSYTRDTILVTFNFSQQLDTTITGENNFNLIGNDPVNYLKTLKGGCNGYGLKSVTMGDWPENDTLIIYELTDTLKVFVGMNLTCCMEFEPGSSISGDTLVMKIRTMNDDFCNCICYYTFDYFFTDYTAQGFYYQFLVDNLKWFEGSHNLP